MFRLYFARLRLAVEAQRRKVVTGEMGMIDSIGVAQSELAPEGKILVHGEIWTARSSSPIAPGRRARVKKVEGLTLWVEPEEDSH